MTNFEHGSVYTKENGQRDWIIGHFIDPKSPFHSKDFEVKWSKLKKGEKKAHPKSNQSAKTLSILAYGKFQIIFPGVDKNIIMDQEGDYVFYDAGIIHAWEVLEDCLVVTIRWPSIAGDQ